MQTPEQALADMKLWLLVLVSLAGISGEMFRASGSNLTMKQILQRVALRFGASVSLGMGTFMLALGFKGDVYMAGGLGIVVAVIGADVAGGLYTQWLAKKAGIEHKIDR